MVPRLIYGDGSFVRIDIVNAKNITDLRDYNVFLTYHEGSFKVEGLKKTLTIEDQILESWNTLPGFLIPLGLGLGFAIPSIISVFLASRQDKNHRIERLNILLDEIIEVFKKGAINEMKFNILNRKISFYMSLLSVKDKT